MNPTELLREAIEQHNLNVMHRAIHDGADVNACAPYHMLPLVALCAVPHFWQPGRWLGDTLDILGFSEEALSLMLVSGAKLDAPLDQTHDYPEVPRMCRTVRERILYSLSTCTTNAIRVEAFAELGIEHEWEAYREFVLNLLQRHQ